MIFKFKDFVPKISSISHRLWRDGKRNIKKPSMQLQYPIYTSTLETSIIYHKCEYRRFLTHYCLFLWVSPLASYKREMGETKMKKLKHWWLIYAGCESGIDIFKSCRTVPLRKDKKELCDFIFFIALLKVNINWIFVDSPFNISRGEEGDYIHIQIFSPLAAYILVQYSHWVSNYFK